MTFYINILCLAYNIIGSAAMSYTLKQMSSEHGAQIMQIFNYYIESSFNAYFEQPLPEAFFTKLQDITQDYPALVIQDVNRQIVGFGFLHAYHPASSLNKTAEISYFIHPDHKRRGLGKKLLDSLIEQSQKHQIQNIIASISSKNEESLFFHQKYGFEVKGQLTAVGRKFGENFDIIMMQKVIQE